MNYAKRKEQLEHILNDESYWDKSDRGSMSFKSFVSDMCNKVSKGATLSSKQEAAINKTVQRYARYFFMNNDPEFKSKTDKFIKETKEKIIQIQQMLYLCNYTRGYEEGAEAFLNSVQKQVESKGTMSDKQKNVLNKMYARFKKRNEKNNKKNKKSA